MSGAAGCTVAKTEFNRKICFEDVSTGGSMMIFDERRDLLDMVRNFSAFFVDESCGFCTPCRVGSSLVNDLIYKVQVGHATRYDLKELQDIGIVMQHSSFCGLGVTAANPVLDTLKKFPEVYSSRLANRGYEPAFDMDAALNTSRAVTGREDEKAHIRHET